jgi:hypothetical protein
MPDITPDNVEAFLERFEFRDSRINLVQLEFLFSGPDKAPRRARVVTETQDFGCADGEWVCMTLEFEWVEHFIVREGFDYTIVVYDQQPSFLFHDGLIYVDLYPRYVGGSSDIEDYKQSLCLIAARRCSWSIEPLPDMEI